MRQISKILALSLLLAGGCGRAGAPQATTPQAADAPAAPRAGLQIGLTTVYVDDQEKAQRFYTEVLGFAVKDDVSSEGYRWLTVTSPGAPDGIQLQLALNDNPAARAFQQAMFQQDQPAIMFFTDDVKREAERIKARGGTFTMEPTDIDVAVIAQLPDTCGNLIQISQVD